MRLNGYQGKLVIFTTFYKYQAYAPYIDSLIKTCLLLDRLGIKWDYWQSVGDFHVERAINTSIERFADSEDATDFLMIDSDESWDPEGVIRLLMHPEGVVAGTYRMTNWWECYVGVLLQRDGHPIGKMLDDGTALLEAIRLPGGFVRFKKDVIRRFRDTYPELRYREGKDVCTAYYERLKAPTNDDPIPEAHSQDYGFSSRCVSMGEQLWIDPMIKINHLGIKNFEGDFDAYLRKTLADRKAEAAFATVRQMAEDIRAKQA